MFIKCLYTCTLRCNKTFLWKFTDTQPIPTHCPNDTCQGAPLINTGRIGKYLFSYIFQTSIYIFFAVFLTSKTAFKIAIDLGSKNRLSSGAVYMDHQPSRIKSQDTVFTVCSFDCDLSRIHPLLNAITEYEREEHIFICFELFKQCMKEGTGEDFKPLTFVSGIFSVFNIYML